MARGRIGSRERAARAMILPTAKRSLLFATYKSSGSISKKKISLGGFRPPTIAAMVPTQMNADVRRRVVSYGQLLDAWARVQSSRNIT